jgi:hypothetical protein
MADENIKGIQGYLKTGETQPRRKGIVRNVGDSSVVELPARKPATIDKIVGTLRRNSTTMNGRSVEGAVPVGIKTPAKPAKTTLPLSGEGFESKYKEEQFYQQFKGLSKAELEAHRTAGTFAKKASTPEEEASMYGRATAMANRGGSKSTKNKAKRMAAETGGITMSESEPGRQSASEIYMGPNVDSSPLKHIEELDNHVATLENYADEANLPAEHKVRVAIAAAHESIGKAYIAHAAGNTSSGNFVGNGPMLGRGRGKSADMGIENATTGSVSHAREAFKNIGIAARQLSDSVPNFKNRGGAQAIASQATESYNKYKSGVGDITGREMLSRNEGSTLFPKHDTDMAKLAEADQSTAAYDMTRAAHRAGSRTVAPGAFSGIAKGADASGIVRATQRVEEQNPVSGASAFATDTSTRRGPEPEPRVGTAIPYGTNSPRETAPAKPANKAQAKKAARAILDAPTVSYKPQRDVSPLAISNQIPQSEIDKMNEGFSSKVNRPAARSTAVVLPQGEVKAGSTGSGPRARTFAYTAGFGSGANTGYEKPTITPEQSTRNAATSDAANAAAHYWSTKRDSLGGDKKYAAKLDKKPELRQQHQAEFENSQAYKNPASYLVSVGKASRSAEFRRPVA